jgi:hypothetical protein
MPRPAGKRPAHNRGRGRLAHNWERGRLGRCSRRGSTSSIPGVDARGREGHSSPWPKTLFDQFQALRSALAAHPGPATPADLAQGFARAPRAKVAELLDILASLGHARRLDDGRYLPG